MFFLFYLLILSKYQVYQRYFRVHKLSRDPKMEVYICELHFGVPKPRIIQKKFDILIKPRKYLISLLFLPAAYFDILDTFPDKVPVSYSFGP